MAGELLIHIGYHKTASSYLQHGIFPQLPVNLFNPDEIRLKMVLNGMQSDVDAFRQWMEREIDNQSGKGKKNLTILSHEAFSGHPQGYKTFSPFVVADKLARTFPNSKILIVVRNQFDYIMSIYAFRVAVKGEEYRSLEDFINSEGSKGLFERLEYHLLVEHYQKLFGKQHVLVLPMELLSKSSDGFLEEILKFIGFSDLKLKVGRPLNVSTKNSFVINFWRPVNFVVRYLIKLVMFVTRKEKKDVRILTYRYLNVKKRITGLLLKIFKNSKKIDITSYSGYQSLCEKFGKSNTQLQGLIDRDLSVLGYPVNLD